MIIFLDIDGVLNTKKEWNKPFTLNKNCLHAFNNALTECAQRDSIRIILISSWRIGFSQYEDRCAKYISELNHSLPSNIKIWGKTKELNNRSEEILDYITSHKFNIHKCIIIDDDKSLYPSLPKEINTLWINPNEGFSKESAYRLIKYEVKCNDLS